MFKSSAKQLPKVEGRLRLRSNNEKSASTILNTTENTLTKKVLEIDLITSSADDSLADFKSPKSKSSASAKNSIEKLSLKNINSKCTLMNSRKKEVRGKNDYLRQSSAKSKKTMEKKQCSIESLFSKKQYEQSIFNCPVCLKQFNNENSWKVHMKSCAVMNNISCDKLIQAIELQEKQAQERKAMGLPSVGPLENLSVKPTSNSTKVKKLLTDDSDMELAMALSISLNQANNVEAESDGKVNVDINSSCRKSTLQLFGFYTDKPRKANMMDKPSRKRKIITSTVLQNRTQDVRNQILAEKIAEVLIGSQPITQYPSQEKNVLSTKNTNHTGRYFYNDALNKYYDSSSCLWKSSQYSTKDATYYVKDLHKSIEPLENNENIENNVMEISTSPETHHHQDDDEKEKNDIHNIDKNQYDSNVVTENQESKNNTDPESHDNTDNVRSLLSDWSRMVANHHLSDIGIFTKDNGFIHAHSLVLSTRCHYLTNNYQICNYKSEKCDHNCEPIKYKIDWPQIDYNTAITFLDYVYCAKIPDIIMHDNSACKQLQFLAKTYNMNCLLKHLNDLESSQGKSEERADDHEIGKKMSIDSDTSELSILDDFYKKSQSHQEQYVEPKDDGAKDIVLSTSPDLFDETEIFNDDNSDNMEGEIATGNCLSSTTNASSEIQDEIEICQSQKNPKSNISLFINKIRRQHARNILDSDTDGDTPQKDIKMYKRNPFCVDNDVSNKNCHVWKKKCNNAIAVDETELSIFERAIRKEMERDNQQCECMEKCQDSFHDKTDGSLDESLYTKYIKTVNENSIGVYRKALGYRKEIKENTNCSETSASPIDFDNPSDIETSSRLENNHNNGNENADHLQNIDFDSCDEETSVNLHQHHSPMTPNLLINHSKEDNHDDVFIKAQTSENVVYNGGEMENKLSPIIISSSDEDESLSSSNKAINNASQNFDSELSQPLETMQRKKNKRLEESSTEPHELPAEVFLTPKKSLIDIQESSLYDISYDITPPKNYERMNTPDLHKQLNIYGLKPQKRCRAIQLLQHIYNELHPLVRVNLLPLSIEFTDNNNENQVNENELKLSRQPVDIKTMFTQLLKRDTKLHTKILLYEPVSLQLIYETLKSEGFKGKMNDVIDFLDSECITFQDKEQDRKNKKKKKTIAEK